MKQNSASNFLATRAVDVLVPEVTLSARSIEQKRCPSNGTTTRGQVRSELSGLGEGRKRSHSRDVQVKTFARKPGYLKLDPRKGVGSKISLEVDAAD